MKISFFVFENVEFDVYSIILDDRRILIERSKNAMKSPDLLKRKFVWMMR